MTDLGLNMLSLKLITCPTQRDLTKVLSCLDLKGKHFVLNKDQLWAKKTVSTAGAPDIDKTTKIKQVIFHFQYTTYLDRRLTHTNILTKISQ